MIRINDYLIMEVEKQGRVKNVEVREDNVLMGYEPQCDLELEEPNSFPKERLVATLCGKPALHQFKKGDQVAVRLNHLGYRENGELINHIRIEDIKLVKELDNLYL